LLAGLTLFLAACQSTPSDSSADTRRTSPEVAAGAAQPASHRDAGRDSAGNSNSSRSSSDRYDLGRDEQRGGHTLGKHVGRTDDELRQRLERERDISAASTWTDRATAEETVAAALRANQSKIDRWNDRGFPRTNLALHFDASHAIGRTLRHGESTAEPCASAVVVLKADRNGGFLVLTTYPEDRE
jgi:hypothetical protein